jgi:AraC family transcriptional regulator of adaptative response / DNA-3-methyladenine glycosylase II
MLFAKHLLHETRLSMADVALASGFGSVRRFNETFQELFRRPPSALRRGARGARSADAGVTVRLRYRSPYDWAAMLSHLQARAIDGVESVERGRYARTFVESGETGTIAIVPLPAIRSVAATITASSVRVLAAAVARIRRLLDLDADVAAIGEYLARDPTLSTLIAARPGLRVPGGWDGFELGIRAILGQQVSVEAARRLLGQLVQICGVRMPDPANVILELTHAFPSAADVAAADLRGLRMPGARKDALVALARAALDDPRLFEPRGTLQETVERLRAIRGIGEWTAHYIALRAVREPDAFPASDVGLLRAGARPDGTRPSPAELIVRAERWRPWRAYAAQHLWASLPSATRPVARARSVERSEPPQAASA